MNKRYREIDIMRGIAIILVLLGHAIIIYPINIKDSFKWCNYLYNLIYSFHMPLFFMISGFCFKYIKGEYISYLKRKIYRLLVPYICFSFIDLISRFVFNNLVNRSKNIVESLLDILLYGGELWFLYVLFLIFLIFPICNQVVKKKVCWGCIMLILIIINYFNITSVLLLNQVSYYSVFFIIGYIIKGLYETHISRMKNNYSTIILITCILFITSTFNIYIFKYVNAMLGCIICYLLASHIKKMQISILMKSNKYSLQLYLFNGYFLVVMRYLVVSVLKIKEPSVIIVLNFFGMWMGGLLIAKLIEKTKFKHLCGM